MKNCLKALVISFLIVFMVAFIAAVYVEIFGFDCWLFLYGAAAGILSFLPWIPIFTDEAAREEVIRKKYRDMARCTSESVDYYG